MEEELVKRVKEVISEQLGIDFADCQEEKTFEDLTGDSLDVLDIIMETEKIFMITIDEWNELPEEYSEMKIGDFIDMVKYKVGIR